jgi:spindle assembly abnormal protein 6
MEERISSLETENRDLLQNKYKSETAAQDSANKIKHFEDDFKVLQQEITLLKKQNDKLDHDYHEKQRLSTNLHNRVTLLETDLRDKQAILQKNHEQLSNLSETKSNLEDHATAMVKEVERVKNVNKMVSAELIKANEIIKKLQDDIRTLNSKTKLQV